MTREEVEKIVNLFIEASKYYDSIIREQRTANGSSQFAIDLLEGNVNIHELAIDYIMEHYYDTKRKRR